MENAFPSVAASAATHVGPRATTTRRPVEAKAAGNLLIADATRVTPRQFLDAIFGDSDETRAARRDEQQRSLIAIIKSGGSLRGWPPMQVSAARKIIADVGSEIAL